MTKTHFDELNALILSGASQREIDEFIQSTKDDTKKLLTGSLLLLTAKSVDKVTTLSKTIEQKTASVVLKKSVKQVEKLVPVVDFKALYSPLVGTSFGMSRGRRTSNTTNLILKNAKNQSRIIKRDALELLRNPRVNGKIAGISFRKQFAVDYKNATSDAERLKLLKAEIKHASEKAVQQNIVKRSNHYANRLLVTEKKGIEETAKVKTAFKKGIRLFKHVAEPDACPICQELNGRIFTVKNADQIPVHPHCRCHYVPIKTPEK